MNPEACSSALSASFCSFADAYVDEDASVLHVRLHAHFADYHRALEPRILQLSRKHGVDFVGDLLTHTFMTVIGWTQLRPRETL